MLLMSSPTTWVGTGPTQRRDEASKKPSIGRHVVGCDGFDHNYVHIPVGNILSPLLA
jgi:hypothetical protein